MDDKSKAPLSSPTQGEVDLALDLVLLVDELTIAIDANEASAKHLTFVRERILQILEMHQVEVIKETTWNPDRQRAVKVDPSNLKLENAVWSATISSGVAIGGKLVKKQAVALKAKPDFQTTQEIIPSSPPKILG